MDFSFFKRHPYATAGVVIVGGVVVFFIWSGGGGSSAAATTSSQNAALDYQYRIAQLGANVQSHAIDSALEAKNVESATVIELASMSHDLEALKANIQGTIAGQAIEAQNHLTDAQLQQVLAQTKATVQLHYADLANQSEARQQQIQDNQLQRAYESERNNMAYMLQYQQNQYAFQTNQDLISLLGQRAA